MSKGPPPVPGGRSPEEREAARREREARRVARGQATTGEFAAAADGRAAEPAPEPRRAPDPKPARGPRWARKQREAAPARPPEAAPQPRRIAPPPRPPADGQRDWLAEARRLTARDGGSDGAASATAAGRRPGKPHAARLLALGVLLIFVLGAAWFAVSLFQPFKGDGGDRTRVVVPRGLGVGQIGDLLERRGVIDSAFFFSTRARLGGKAATLKPGTFELREGMPYGAALAALEKGTPPNLVVVTVPEGRSRREVAPLVNGRLEGSYAAATRRSEALDPRDYGARNATSLEGFLFPATYELKRGRPVTELVDRQLAAFRRNFDSVGMSHARSKNLTPYEVLIIASLVEREASVAAERPVIASVIYNRLKQGIPLGIDATVRFATGNWSRPLRESELRNPSPYNTRRTSGLPPGPIGSPGLDSIRAAARPARSKYLFYVVKPCGNGRHAFSATDAEFQRDVRRYNEEREKRGGQSPTNC